MDAKEAATLLPLWEAYSQLTTSDTTAPAEMTAVVSQIQGTMTLGQVQAITSMKMTQKDLSAAISALGVVTSPTSSSSGTTSISNTLSGGTTNAATLNVAGDPQGSRRRSDFGQHPVDRNQPKQHDLGVDSPGDRGQHQ